jgi:hypothetical protein
MTGWQITDEQEKNLERNGSVFTEAVSRLLPRDTKENYEMPQSG